MSNVVDRQNVVHVVWARPTNIKMGRTACMILFTTPVYSPDWSASRWLVTDDHVTCLECVTAC